MKFKSTCGYDYLDLRRPSLTFFSQYFKTNIDSDFVQNRWFASDRPNGPSKDAL